MSEEEMVKNAEEIKRRELKKSPQEHYDEWTAQHPVATRRIGTAIKVLSYVGAFVGGVLIKSGVDMLKNKFSEGNSSDSDDSSDDVSE